MTTHALEHPRGAHLPAAFTRQVRWLAGGFAIGFLVPFVFAEVLNLPRDLYYAVYITAVLVFFVLWARASGEVIGEMVRRRWKLTTLLTVLTVILMSVIVLRTQDATPHPDALMLAGAIAWRGVAYGLADGLLLGLPHPGRLRRLQGHSPAWTALRQGADRSRRDRRVAGDDGGLPRGLQRLSLRQGARAAERRCVLERPDALHTEPPRGADRACGHACHRGASQLRHRRDASAAPRRDLRSVLEAEGARSSRAPSSTSCAYYAGGTAKTGQGAT